jgi:hypothetical protein
MPRSPRVRVLTSVLVATLLSGGCATTATIRTPVGARAYERRAPTSPVDVVGRAVVSPLEVTIVGSDASTVYFNDDNGNPLQLGQYHVSEIDHPGNVLAWLGAPFLGFGAAILAALYSRPSDQKDGDGFVGIGYLMGWTSVVMGGVLVISGTWSWGRSKLAARTFESSRPPDWLIPPAAPERPAFDR